MVISDLAIRHLMSFLGVIQEIWHLLHEVVAGMLPPSTPCGLDAAQIALFAPAHVHRADQHGIKSALATARQDEADLRGSWQAPDT